MLLLHCIAQMRLAQALSVSCGSDLVMQLVISELVLVQIQKSQVVCCFNGPEAEALQLPAIKKTGSESSCANGLRCITIRSNFCPID